MNLDSLSFVAPARVKVLVVPVGHTKRSTFLSSLGRLQQESVVRLGDVSPDGRPHRTMFSPLAFPTGLVLYDLTTALPPPSQLALAPFELYREPLIVIAIADYNSIGGTSRETATCDNERTGSSRAEDSQNTSVRSFVDDLEKIKTQFPKALVHQVLIFDHAMPAKPLHEGVVYVPTVEKSKTTTMKTVMCDLTSQLLAEMTSYAKSLQALPSLESPRSVLGLGNGDLYNAKAPISSRPTSALHGMRSLSPAGTVSKTEGRMSMPVHISSSTISRDSTPDGRAMSPPDRMNTPPTTFDEIAATPEGRRRSRDRVSMQGFGAGGAGERERIKGKGRICIVIGSLYLLAGRWPDAVKELAEGATIARANTDYLWHGKALDYLAVCLVMYAWAGMEFRIPQILVPGAEKPGSNVAKPAKHTPSNSIPDVPISTSTSTAGRLESMQNLINLLPDLANNILNIYSRAWTFTDDKIPQLAFSETTIRFAKLLTVIQVSHGRLDDDGLKRVVLNTTISYSNDKLSQVTAFLTRTELTALLFRAFPDPSSETPLSVSDRIIILAGIASVLSELGYHRKKAIVLKELVSALLPALVQARKDGAAEMGVHPAASLPSFDAAVKNSSLHKADNVQGNTDHDVQSLLEIVCHAYGILVAPSLSRQNFSDHDLTVGKENPTSASPLDTDENVVARVIQQASLHALGAQELKLDILRSCINLCEALPDLGGVLRFSADMLRVAGKSVALGPDSDEVLPALPVEEQVRLANNINRTIGAARQLGLDDIEANYWDEFLIRGVEMLDSYSAQHPIKHAKSELEVVDIIEAKPEKSPFIYNPFIRSTEAKEKEPILVAGEEAVFRVTLQNMYELDVEIESLSLEVSGVSFDGFLQRTTIGPYRTQMVLLSGVPKSSGSLTITGCIAKIKGCRKRRFPIFKTSWTYKPGPKAQRQGFDAISGAVSRPTSTASDPGKSKTTLALQGPSTSTVTLKVIGAQPDVILKSLSLAQSAIMLLEGETTSFVCTLENISPSVPVDIMTLSFVDSTASQVQAALSSKELSSVETYELELASSQKQAFRWQIGDRDIKIGSGEEMHLRIEVFGKPGLSHGTILVDYGYLGVPKSDVKDIFYTRRFTIPLTVTVNASVELCWNDLIPFTSDFAWQNQQRQQQLTANFDKSSNSSRSRATSRPSPNPENRFQALLSRIGLKPHDTHHCLLLLDLRNSWPTPLSISIQVRSSTPQNPAPTDSPNPSSEIPGTSTDIPTHAYTLHDSILPGGTTRLILILPRPCLPSSQTHLPIPQTTKKQFILNTSTTAPTRAAELTAREAFWYREHLLSLISASWTEDSTGRTGAINLRSMRLSTRMVNAYKLDDLDMSFSLSIPSSPTPSLNPPRLTTLAPTTYITPTCTALTLTTHLRNRSSHPIHPLLRLLPALSNQPHHIALDLSKKLLIHGLLQRPLPVLEAGETKDVEVGVVVLGAGVYEVGGLVEDVKVLGDVGDGVDGANGGEETRDKKIWVAERPCVLIARDEETDG